MRTDISLIVCICGGVSLIANPADARRFALPGAQMTQHHAELSQTWHFPVKPESTAVLTNNNPLCATNPTNVSRDVSRFTVVQMGTSLQHARAPCRRGHVAKVELRPRIRDPTV